MCPVDQMDHVDESHERCRNSVVSAISIALFRQSFDNLQRYQRYKVPDSLAVLSHLQLSPV